MSYGISYRRQAFKLTAKEAGYYEDVLFLVEEAGDNNCWEIGNRRRARDWRCLAVGSDWWCLAEVTRMAAACCGGSLVLYGRRRRTRPETYIRAWRRAIAEATLFAEAQQLGFHFELFVRMTDGEARGSRKFAFTRLQDQSLVDGRRCGLGESVPAWEWKFDPTQPAQVRLWVGTGGARARRTVDVRGPER